MKQAGSSVLVPLPLSSENNLKSNAQALMDEAAVVVNFLAPFDRGLYSIKRGIAGTAFMGKVMYMELV